MMKAVNAKEFDMVASWSVDRLGRSLTNLLSILQGLHEKGVGLFTRWSSSWRINGWIGSPPLLWSSRCCCRSIVRPGSVRYRFGGGRTPGCLRAAFLAFFAVFFTALFAFFAFLAFFAIYCPLKDLNQFQTLRHHRLCSLSSRYS